MKKEYILVIDSGTGGLSILGKAYRAISANFIYFADNKNCPYGKHKKKEIFGFLKSIIDKVLSRYKVSVVVLACNTATTSSISKLRSAYPDLIFVGTEPAIKLACNLGYKNILMISTPVTANQKKYRELKSSLNSKILTLKMPNFAENIEKWLTETASLDLKLMLTDRRFEQEHSGCHHMNSPNLCAAPDSPKPADLKQHGLFPEMFFAKPNFELRMKLLKDLFSVKFKAKNCDCIVLGCTHYSLIAGIMQSFLDKPLISGNFGVAREIQRHFHPQNSTNSKNNVKFLFSNPGKEIEQIYKKIFMQILANN